MSASNGENAERLAIYRQLKIKAGVTKRLLKEHNLYGKEAGEQQLKLDKMIAENAEDWEIRQAKRIFDESQRMIKDTSVRLGKAVQELQTLVSAVKTKPEFSEDKELAEAEKELGEASAVVGQASPVST
ncbi:tubulin binding cofactor A [Paxillus ammoniavirescens]|nr:tubulin binding cofactor A [Paxillus ammoniavirescens]